MKKNDIADLRTKSVNELKTLLADTQKEEARTKLELAMYRQTNRHAAKAVRRKNAIIKTLLREKALTGSK